jgi:lysophospholipase L1-like esterase
MMRTFNRMKVVFLGNSLTEGVYGANYVAALAARYPAHTLINEGHSGDTIYNVAAHLPRVLAHQADVVFTLLGGNDAISYAQPDTRNYYRRSKGVPDGVVQPTAFRTLFRQMLVQLTGAGAQVRVALAPTEHNPAVVAAMQTFNSIMQEEAHALAIPTLDLFRALVPPQVPDRPPLTMAYVRLIGARSTSGWRGWDELAATTDYAYTFDGIHITSASARRFVDLIAPFVGLS